MTASAQLQDGARAGLPAFVDRIRLRARRRALWMRALWANDSNGAVQGVIISSTKFVMFSPTSAATSYPALLVMQK